jgi:hypothetical protein
MKLIGRGYARTIRDKERLVAFGFKSMHVYLEDKTGTVIDNIRMRRGEVLATVGGLRALGDNRRGILTHLRRFHDQGAAVLDIETNMRSDQRGAEMLDAALGKLQGERRIPTKAEARRRQALSVKARTKDRTPKREALRLWRNPEYTMAEVEAALDGWSATTLWREFGPRGISTGPRGGKKR